MILIQDGSQNTNVDKPLRIIGDPYKVQVSAPCWWWWGLEKERDRETGGWARDWHESGEAGDAGHAVGPGHTSSCRSPSQRSCANVIQTPHLFS